MFNWGLGWGHVGGKIETQIEVFVVWIFRRKFVFLERKLKKKNKK